jgi:DtxR family manganese transport transcriptional regulator
MNAEQSTPATRQRSDHAMENAEDYVELIDDLQKEIGAAHKSDIATRLGVSHVTVHKTIKRLKSMGLVHAEAHRAVSLTETGRALAYVARERHQLLLRFLGHLGVSKEEAENDSEGLEHHLGKETEKAMRKFCESMEKNGSYTRASSLIKNSKSDAKAAAKSSKKSGKKD